MKNPNALYYIQTLPGRREPRRMLDTPARPWVWGAAYLALSVGAVVEFGWKAVALVALSNIVGYFEARCRA